MFDNFFVAFINQEGKLTQNHNFQKKISIKSLRMDYTIIADRGTGNTLFIYHGLFLTKEK